ncbi:MarR family winged helix-turn-helix transcriptional regulator [Kitasatospora sp. NPDC098652]|uniref:MarR family winged helix-turn-helix transcriptional regulator n=1 Tax=Kitasatospora sp. NPDC098652 TaxID=3364095 RepID=UPI0038032490
MTTTPTDDPADPSPGPRPGAPGTSGTSGTSGVPAELADAMTRAIKRIRRQTGWRLEPYGITPGQARALRTLAHVPGCETPDRAMRLSDLADKLHIAPRSATTVVDALEEAGLVERRPDPADRRAVRILLTEEGRAAVERILQVRDEVAQDYFGEVSPEDEEVLLRVLRAAEARFLEAGPPPRTSPPGAAR